MKLIHDIGTALVVKVAAVVFVYQSSLLSLELSAVDRLFPVLSGSLDPNLELIYVLLFVGTYNFSFSVLSLFSCLALSDLTTPVHLFVFIGTIVLEVFELFFDLLLITINFILILLFTITIIFFFVILTLKFLQQLNVLCRWETIESRATIVDHIDLYKHSL